MKILCVALIFTAGVFANEVGFAEVRVSAEKRQEIEKSEFASKTYSSAVSLARNNDPRGFLLLYEISSDDIKYTVEYSELASNQMSLLLYSKTELWIRTYARVEQGRFRERFKGLDDSQLPDGVSSLEELENAISLKLEKMGSNNTQERDLIQYVFRLIGKPSKQGHP